MTAEQPNPIDYETILNELLHSHGIAVPDEYPLDTDAVLELCDRLDYAVDENRLAYWSDLGLHCPLEWQAVEILGLFANAENSRFWKPMPSKHDSKKSFALRAKESATDEGVQRAIEHIKRFSLRDIVLRLLHEPSAERRELYFVCFESAWESLLLDFAETQQQCQDVTARLDAMLSACEAQVANALQKEGIEADA